MLVFPQYLEEKNKGLLAKLTKDKNAKIDFFNISGAQSIQMRIDKEHSDIRKKRIYDFGQDYPMLRDVQGDGNCFFRGVAYNYFEMVVNNMDKYGQKAQFERFLNRLIKKQIDLKNSVYLWEDNEFQNSLNDILYQGLLKIYQCAFNMFTTLQNRISEIFDLFRLCSDFDMASNYFMRFLCIEGIVQLQNQMKDWLYDDSQEIIINKLKNNGEFAEGVIPPILAHKLDIQIQICDINIQEGNNYRIPYRPLDSVSKDILGICLMFTVAHYDVCYTKEYSTKFYKAHFGQLQLKNDIIIYDEYPAHLSKKRLNIIQLEGQGQNNKF